MERVSLEKKALAFVVLTGLAITLMFVFLRFLPEFPQSMPVWFSAFYVLSIPPFAMLVAVFLLYMKRNSHWLAWPVILAGLVSAFTWVVFWGFLMLVLVSISSGMD